jgi:hypothetical protein
MALEYAYKVREGSKSTSIFWVHASNADKFKQGYQKIAKEIDIPGADDPATSTLSLVKSWLTGHDCGSWIMIIDNADDSGIFYGQVAESTSRCDGESELQHLSNFIPQSPRGSVLFTTKTNS